MKSFKQFLQEEISFNYNHSIRANWINLTYDAMKKFNIRFNLENFDPVGDIKTYKSNFPSMFDTSFTYQMQKGGGDWETPTISFRCQLTKGFLKGIGSYDKNNGCFVFIPNIEEGNINLVVGKKETLVPLGESNKEVQKLNEQQCVKSLKSYLDKLVSEYDESRKSEKEKQQDNFVKDE